MIKYLLSITSLFSIVFSYSQQVKNYCNNNNRIEQKLKEDPSFQFTLDSISKIQRQHLQSYRMSSAANRSTVYYIPVVYHVLHQDGEENISDAQIHSDIEQMNNMFRKSNASVANVNPTFAPIAADIEIEFRLAQKKNDGTCFSGITRTYSPATNQGGNLAVSNVRAHHGDFPGDKYLNIFVSKNIGGAAGYTHKPVDTLMENGIHVLHSYVGTIGTSSQTIENSTTAHEVGHWLNLDHTWGGSNSPGDSTNCAMDDSVSDTPLTLGWNTCNVNGSSCGSLDNTENIMEYSYCPNSMFTEGQKTRMRAALTSPIAGRNKVITPNNYIATGIFDSIMCTADFTYDHKTICEGQQVHFFDNSSHKPTSWNWSFPGGSPSTSTQQNPIVTYPSTGTFDVSLTASNGSGSASTTKSLAVDVKNFIGVNPHYTQGFENNESKYWASKGTNSYNWTVTNATSYSGDNCLTLQNISFNTGNTVSFISPNINLENSTTANLSFQYGYAHKTTTTNESLKLYISNDCGNTWVFMRNLLPTIPNTDRNFISNLPNHWNQISVNVSPAYFVPNFKFKIELKTAGGNNVYVDDINMNTVVGVNELETIKNFDIYPNPTANNTNVAITLAQTQTISLSLVSVTGQTIKTITNNKVMEGKNTFSIDCSKLTKGVYFVKLEANGASQIKKLVVQ